MQSCYTLASRLAFRMHKYKWCDSRSHVYEGHRGRWYSWDCLILRKYFKIRTVNDSLTRMLKHCRQEIWPTFWLLAHNWSFLYFLHCFSTILLVLSSNSRSYISYDEYHTCTVNAYCSQGNAKHNLRFEVIQNKVYIGSPATEEMLLECTQNFDTFWPFQNLCYPLNKYNIARVWIMVLHDVCIVIFMLPLNEPYTMNPSYISRTSLLLGGCL